MGYHRRPLVRGRTNGLKKLFYFENIYSPSKHSRQQTISNTNEIKQL